jgi:hypothetical protein
MKPMPHKAPKVGGVPARRMAAPAPAAGPKFGDVVYNGGVLISRPRVHISFWGPSWSQPAQRLEAQAEHVVTVTLPWDSFAKTRYS